MRYREKCDFFATTARKTRHIRRCFYLTHTLER
jgi:hypothetical protein